MKRKKIEQEEKKKMVVENKIKKPKIKKKKYSISRGRKYLDDLLDL